MCLLSTKYAYKYHKKKKTNRECGGFIKNSNIINHSHSGAVFYVLWWKLLLQRLRQLLIRNNKKNENNNKEIISNHKSLGNNFKTDSNIMITDMMSRFHTPDTPKHLR